MFVLFNGNEHRVFFANVSADRTLHVTILVDNCEEYTCKCEGNGHGKLKCGRNDTGL